jgi:shikimate kinase
MPIVFDLQGINIYLIGMSGSGKSTISSLLAESLGYGFVDTDPTIEKLVGQSVAEIFQTSGEPKFRQLETQVIAEISAHTRLVVATGGGIAMKLENWSHLHQGLVVWLNVSVDVLVERLTDGNTSPILNASEDLQPQLQQILADRRDRYAEADIHIPITSNLPPTEIVEQIINRLNSI